MLFNAMLKPEVKEGGGGEGAHIAQSKCILISYTSIIISILYKI